MSGGAVLLIPGMRGTAPDRAFYFAVKFYYHTVQ